MAKAVGIYTIADLNDGPAGNSAIQAVLSNESHTLTANSSGVPSSYAGASTTITVYEGSNNVTSQFTIAKSDPTGVTSTLSGNTVSVTNVSNGVGGSITITATKGTVVLTKVFTVSVSKTGQDGSPGSPGTSAKVVDINASSQIFKSTTGSAGTFEPQYIYLYPSFQGCTYSKWQYSTDGTTWNNVTSGQHGLTIGTYSSTENTLRIARDCDLFTVSITTLSFKCVSSNSSVYDTITVLKVYDVTDIEISGRNILIDSNNILYSPVNTSYLTAENNVLKVTASGAGRQDVSFSHLISDDVENELSTDLQTIFNLQQNLVFSISIKLEDFNTGSVSFYMRYFDSSDGTLHDSNVVTVNASDFISGTDYLRIKNMVLAPLSSYTVGDELYLRGKFDNANSGASLLYKDLKIEVGSISTDWSPAPEDSDKYVEKKDVDIISETRSRTFIETPTTPYNVGDTWVVTDETDDNYGKILTCVIPRDSDEDFTLTDWIVPLSAYTTITQMTQVLGKDPSSWDVTQGTVTQLLDENKNEIVGLSSDLSKFSIRSSNIEMSFSKTGTMNFLANSSGQNKLNDWTVSNENSISVVNSTDAADVRRSLVSGSAFAVDIQHGSVISMKSNRFVAPTSDSFVISFKLKSVVKYSVVKMKATFWDSKTGTAQSNIVGTKTYKYPYVSGAEEEFILYHEIINRNDSAFSGVISYIDLEFTFYPESDQSTVSSVDPTTLAGKISEAGNIYQYGGMYYYIKPIYRQYIVDEFGSADELSGLTLYGDHVYKCIREVKGQNNEILYVRGTYYTNRNDALQNVLRPITDSYYITLLDANDLYFSTLTGGSENIETSSTAFTATTGRTYLGDIMVNGGNQVMTWTPRQDEVLWGENIKFSSNGIYIENKDSGFGRQLTSNSDIAFRLAGDGTITEYIWKLTQTGFIAKDIKCFGTFAMGTTSSGNVDLENSFSAILEMKRNNNNTGVDDYIYVN